MHHFLSDDDLALQESVAALAHRHFAANARDFERADAQQREKLVASARSILGEAGLLGIRIPEEYGGGDGSLLQAVVAIEALARVNPYVGNLMATGVGNQTLALVAFGSDQVKHRYLPRIAQGRCGGAIAITEPDAGSDVGALRTRLTSGPSGYVLDGTKVYITDADVSEFMIVAARMSDDEGTAGVGLVVVARDTPGVSIDRVDVNMMGGREVALSFTQVAVEPEEILLPPGQFKRFLGLHNAQRCGTGAVSVGVAQGAYDEALAFAQDRMVFGQAVAAHQGIRWMLADMAVKLESMRLIVHRAATVFSPERRETPAESFMAKLYANETAVEVTADALQVLGCFGLSRDGLTELRFRYSKGLCVAGGTTQVLRNGLAHQLIERGVN